MTQTLSSTDAFQRFDNHARTTAICAAGAIAALAIGVGAQFFQPHFVVRDGDNLVKKLGYDQAIHLAHSQHLPIYLGTAETPRILPISAAAAMHLKSQTNQIQIFVPLYSGDKIDMRFGPHFTPTPDHPISSR